MHTVTRLLEQFIPKHYIITWDLTKINKPTRRITGSVTITGQRCKQDNIRLHAAQLAIKSVSVDNTEAKYSIIDDELLITHNGEIGQTTITIQYELEVTDSMHGIYPCYYKINGVQQELYATQFESHHAREAFPCVDEPAAKATFDVILVTEDTPTVLSNMPIVATHVTHGISTTTFDRTPLMSSYLLAFVVGDLQHVKAKTSNGIEVRVFATRAHKKTALRYALEHATKTIDYFDDYFGVPYPLPKNDHVALPDFSSGAMENWGLVTYREIALLADPATASINNKQYVAEVVAHELSHQWFGNLVTMKWWDNLWLNESFATIMEYLAPNSLHPEWDLWFEFSTNEGVLALRRDCIDGVQPVQVDVRHPDEITSLFDGAIVYAKGGRLMRMLQTWVGEDAFRKGLKDYFLAHQYANTSGDDLWNALSNASKKDVKSLMNAWITQSGYPVVNVSLRGNTLTLQQEQFFVGPHKPSSTIWPIPLRGSSSAIPELLSTVSVNVPFTDTAALHLNYDDSGHYIVNYDTELRRRIIEEITDGNASNVQRAQFLHEQLMLARGGYVSSASLLGLLPVYKDETNEKVWGMLSLAISDLKRFVEDDEIAESQLKAYVGKLSHAQYTRLGWKKLNNESEDDSKLRAIIIGNMLYSEDKHVIDQAIKLFRSDSIESLDPELRGPLMGAAVRHSGDSTIVEALIEQYRTTSHNDIQSDITYALASSKDPEVLQRLITLLTDTSVIRTQDTIRWFVSLLRNKKSRTNAWSWMRENWDWIEKTFASDKSHDYFPRYSANILTTRSQLGEYSSFFTPLKKNISLKRSIDMGILDLTGRVELIEKDGPLVKSALAKL